MARKGKSSSLLDELEAIPKVRRKTWLDGIDAETKKALQEVRDAHASGNPKVAHLSCAQLADWLIEKFSINVSKNTLRLWLGNGG